MNQTWLFSLRGGLDSKGDRYGLEPLPAHSIPSGAQLISCAVVSTRRVRGGELGDTPGMVCLAMIAAPEATAASTPAAQRWVGSGGVKRGDAAAGPSTRSLFVPAAESASGILNVYAMGGEKSYEVERALQREPLQLPLLYTPVGVAHATIWRNVPHQTFVEAAASRVERGDAVLVWDTDGAVHGYTRWEKSYDSDTKGVSSTGANTVGSGVAAIDGAAFLMEESRENLELLIPELKSVDSSVMSLATSAVDEGQGMPRRRRMVVGTLNGVCRFSVDSFGGKKERAHVCVNGSVSGVTLNSHPPLFPSHEVVGDYDEDDHRGPGQMVGSACTRHGTIAWLVKDSCSPSSCENARGSSGNSHSSAGKENPPRWLTRTTPLADGEQLVCVSCVDYSIDGTASVAVGTNRGRVVVFDAVLDLPEHLGGRDTEGGGGRNAVSGSVRSAAVWPNVVEDLASEAHSRRGESISPRSSGPDRDRFHHVSDAQPVHAATTDPRHLAAKWQRDMPHTAYGITFGDFNHDGVSEMVIATEFGVHVFRPDYDQEANRLAETLHALRMLQPVETDDEEGPPTNIAHANGEISLNSLGISIHPPDAGEVGYTGKDR